MTIKNNQLTPFPVGSIREAWAISWPLILSMMSMSLMLFFDRLLLSRYSVSALDAAALAGTVAFSFLMLPITISAISEVFVGRFNGEGRKEALGWPVWQMIWLTLMLLPLLSFLGVVMPPFLFEEINYEQESAYFTLVMCTGPLFIASTAVAGFFVGTGKVRIVTITAIAANLINIGLDYLLIYGYGPIPSLGVKGAAIATAIAEASRLLFLGAIFLSKENRALHGTGVWRFNKGIFLESLRIGFPSGLGLSLEIAVHYGFFTLMQKAGPNQLTVAALTQSFYMLVFFTFEGLSKGITALCSNLLGSDSPKQALARVVRSGIFIQSCFGAFLGVLLLFFHEAIIDLFLNQREEVLLLTSELLSEIKWAFFWLWVFYLADGYSRVLIGLLTAAGDTAFLLYSGTLLNLLCYLLPLYIVVEHFNGGASAAWMVISGYGLSLIGVIIYRCRSGLWMVSSHRMRVNSVAGEAKTETT